MFEQTLIGMDLWLPFYKENFQWLPLLMYLCIVYQVSRQHALTAKSAFDPREYVCPAAPNLQVPGLY